MRKIKKIRIVENTDGETCRTCGEIAEAREHNGISEKQLRQPFYYSRWYNCKNKDCRTTIFMVEKYKVLNEGVRQRKSPIVDMYEQQSFWMKNL